MSNSSVPKNQLPLTADQEAILDEARPLSCYKLQYQNPRYPVLAFLYAIYAGGEHAHYCDHAEDFAAAYLTGPRGNDAAGILAPELLEKRRKGEFPIVPSRAQWDTLWPLLRAELEQVPPPLPMW